MEFTLANGLELSSSDLTNFFSLTPDRHVLKTSQECQLQRMVPAAQLWQKTAFHPRCRYEAPKKIAAAPPAYVKLEISGVQELCMKRLLPAPPKSQYDPKGWLMGTLYHSFSTP